MNHYRFHLHLLGFLSLPLLFFCISNHEYLSLSVFSIFSFFIKAILFGIWLPISLNPESIHSKTRPELPGKSQSTVFLFFFAFLEFKLREYKLHFFDLKITLLNFHDDRFAQTFSKVFVSLLILIFFLIYMLVCIFMIYFCVI